jgi:hypothetical protein
MSPTKSDSEIFNKGYAQGIPALLEFLKAPTRRGHILHGVRLHVHYSRLVPKAISHAQVCTVILRPNYLTSVHDFIMKGNSRICYVVRANEFFAYGRYALL